LNELMAAPKLELDSSEIDSLNRASAY
jgi:hypothetical protein